MACAGVLRSLGFTLPAAIAVALDEGDIGMVSEPVDEGDDAGGVGKDGVPILEGEVGGDDQGPSFLVSGVDDLVCSA